MNDPARDIRIYGTAEHAAVVAEGRHPGVRDGLQWLTFAHLPEALQRFSRPFYAAAIGLVETVTTDSPELTTAINRLIEAKDSAVRAGIRHDTGRAGSVSRPQAIVNPPTLTYNDQTLEKVHAALADGGLDDEQLRIAAIGAMQNRGILFRERASVEPPKFLGEPECDNPACGCHESVLRPEADTTVTQIGDTERTRKDIWSPGPHHIA